MAESKAYAQWIAIIIQNKSVQEIQIKNVKLDWGKFYNAGNKDDEIPASTHEGKKIPAGGSYEIYSCGRENASSGTEGSFNLYDTSNSQLIRTVYWDCPWSGSNKYYASGSNDSWIVQTTSIPPDGAIGTVTVTLVKI